MEGIGVGAETAAGIAAGAVSAVAGDIAGQGFGLATGIQSKFNWSEVGMAAISGGVFGGLKGGGAFDALGIGGSDLGSAAARGALSSALTQGIGVATGLQSKFDWAGVASAGAGAAAMSYVGGQLAGVGAANGYAAAGLAGTAGAIANAAARTLITGTDFGDNIIRALPDTIGQTIGNAIAGSIDQSSQMTPAEYQSRMDQYNAALDSGASQDQLAALYQSLGLDTAPTSVAMGYQQSIYNTPIEVSDLPPIEDNGLIDPQIGSVRVLIFKPGATLVPVIRKSSEMFTTTALNAEKGQGLTLVVNGEEYSLANGYLNYLSGAAGIPQNPADTGTIGEVIQNGQVVAGRSSPLGFYVAESTDSSGNVTYNFGQGDPSLSSTAAFGGGIPLIINGLNYGDTNQYDSNGTLIQKSNLGFASLDNFGAATGKIIIAYSDSSGQLAVVVQPNNVSNGMSLPAIRNYLSSSGFNNAIAFDGSSSATLVMNNAVQIAPVTYKNATIDVGIGVKYKGH